jgi:uroporphyrinogen-III synthase
MKNPGDATSFVGLHVAAFESRRSGDMARLIERHGGVAHVSPSMREVPLASNPAAIDFANRIITGQMDVVIFMTGVGVRHWINQLDRRLDRDRLLAALSDVTSLARGPKPVAALAELGIRPTHVVPEPNTWREVLGVLDAHHPVANCVVGLQEYGEPNPSLIAGLEARGAKVVRLKVYDWELPEDTRPLEANVRAIAAGKIEVVLFTSAHQVTNLLHVAAELGLEDPLCESLSRVVVASIGPTTSDQLRRYGLAVDIEPEHPKMGHLVRAAATDAAEVRARKQRMTAQVMVIPEGEPSLAPRPAWYDSLFMKACRREPCPVTPVWLMRQAGRYLPEYRQIRATTTFLELCRNAKLASEVMVTAVERLGVDAAILFSDLLPILEPMGLQLEFAEGEGPVIRNPVREASDVDRVGELESVESLHFAADAA